MLSIENQIKKLAYHYWILHGRPNGEEYIDTFYFGRIKIKDWHWKVAKDKIFRWGHNKTILQEWELMSKTKLLIFPTKYGYGAKFNYLIS